VPRIRLNAEVVGSLPAAVEQGAYLVVLEALNMHSDDAHLRHALNAGARGYLLKDAEPYAIIRAIVAVGEGQAIFRGSSSNPHFAVVAGTSR
jgi:DNA-binding NarL/FixJ family response regulator